MTKKIINSHDFIKSFLIAFNCLGPDIINCNYCNKDFWSYEKYNKHVHICKFNNKISSKLL